MPTHKSAGSKLAAGNTQEFQARMQPFLKALLDRGELQMIASVSKVLGVRISRDILLESLEITTFDAEKDTDKAKELNKLSLLDSPISNYWQDSWNSLIDRIPQEYLERGGAFLMVTFHGRLVAMGGLLNAGGNTAVLEKLRVHPEARGIGIAKILVEKREQIARERGYTEMLANINVKNLPMHALIEELGYTFKNELVEGKDLEEGITMRVYRKKLEPTRKSE